MTMNDRRQRNPPFSLFRHYPYTSGLFLALLIILAVITTVNLILTNRARDDLAAQQQQSDQLRSIQQQQGALFNVFLRDFTKQQDFICTVTEERARMAGLPIPSPDPCSLKPPG